MEYRSTRYGRIFFLFRFQFDDATIYVSTRNSRFFRTTNKNKYTSRRRPRHTSLGFRLRRRVLLSFDRSPTFAVHVGQDEFSVGKRIEFNTEQTRGRDDVRRGPRRRDDTRRGESSLRYRFSSSSSVKNVRLGVLVYRNRFSYTLYTHTHWRVLAVNAKYFVSFFSPVLRNSVKKEIKHSQKII